MIRGFRDPLQVGLDRVAERGQGDDGLRWKSAPPSSRSSAPYGVGQRRLETPLRLAARVKLRSSHSARK
jgi:hypothetical protein